MGQLVELLQNAAFTGRAVNIKAQKDTSCLWFSLVLFLERKGLTVILSPRYYTECLAAKK